MVNSLCKAALLVFFALSFAGCGDSPADSEDASSNKQEKQKDVSGAASGTTTDATDGKVKKSAKPVVVIETSLGDISVELEPEKTPLTVSNFLDYVDSGFYDQTIFHQVMPAYAILGGSYTADLKEKETQTTVRNEADAGLANTRGTIAMARLPETIDSATSQFFINLVDNPDLDHKGRDAAEYGYCAFGRVVKGMDVADKISKVKVENSGEFQQKPVEAVVIKRIRRAK